MLRVYECVYVFCVCGGELFISWQLEAERAGKELDKTSPSMLHFQCPLTSKSFYYLPQRPSDSEAMNKLIHVNISALRMSTSHSSVALNIATWCIRRFGGTFGTQTRRATNTGTLFTFGIAEAEAPIGKGSCVIGLELTRSTAK